MKLPFIYICSLMRSGSTFLQEALTKPPHSLILCEPRFKGAEFRFNKDMQKQMKAAGMRVPRASNVRAVFEELNKGVAQVGVKEIRNHGWKGYLKEFKSDIKVIIIGRDPRDIYISAHGVFHRNNSWRPRYGMNPEGLYKEVLEEVRVQQAMADFDFTVKVKYESLCKNFDKEYSRLKKFVNSPIPDGVVGEVGKFHATISAAKKHEVATHQFKVTAKSVDRWKIEQNKDLLDQANEFFDLMADYHELWGYK